MVVGFYVLDCNFILVNYVNPNLECLTPVPEAPTTYINTSLVLFVEKPKALVLFVEEQPIDVDQIRYDILNRYLNANPFLLRRFNSYRFETYKDLLEIYLDIRLIKSRIEAINVSDGYVKSDDVFKYPIFKEIFSRLVSTTL